MHQKSLISEIHNEIPIKYNSVNVLVGKQGCGKTVAALSKIIKISTLDAHHLLIYVTKTGDENEKSWQALKSLLCMPVIVVSESSVIDTNDEIIAAKNLYYLIKRENLENKQEEEQQKDMLSILHISDFTAEQLRTIILFDDISNSKLFSSEESYFSQQHYIYSQSSSCLTYEEFSELYHTLAHRQCLTVQVSDGGETFIYPQ